VEIFTGPFFKISVEIKPARFAGHTHLLNAKSSDSHSGGFFLSLGNNGESIRFDLADGNNRFTFTALLKTPLARGPMGRYRGEL
jgi:hypothetical protein